jgi:hypothetical protein
MWTINLEDALSPFSVKEGWFGGSVPDSSRLSVKNSLLTLGPTSLTSDLRVLCVRGGVRAKPRGSVILELETQVCYFPATGLPLQASGSSSAKHT